MTDNIEEQLINPEKPFSLLVNGVDVAPEMINIPGGTFQMGSKESSEEQPVHQVSVDPFYISRFVITQAQWRAVAELPKVNNELNGEPQSELSDDFKSDQLPTIEVSWYEAKEFCARLSQATGYTYGLPSEAQWEYACRAGTTTHYSFGDEITQEYANYENAIGGITPAEQYPPNAFGLYDMHGNVWEWCEDTWHDNYNGAPNDGSAWVDDENETQIRLLRGGSWVSYAQDCRCSLRNRDEPSTKSKSIGFRVVCSQKVDSEAQG